MTGAPIELFHRLTQRDLAFPHWGPHHSGVFTSANNIVVATTLADWDANDQLPPRGTLLFITHIQVQITPGNVPAAVSVTQFDLSIFNRNTNTGHNIMSRDDGVANLWPERMIEASAFDFALRLDRDFLLLTGVFTAAATTNRVQFQWTGYIVPQGELGY